MPAHDREQRTRLAPNEAAPRHGYGVAIDTGGTFTDVAVSRPDGTMLVWKVSSSPAAPDQAVVTGLLEALGQLEARPEDVNRFVHGTTVATNALLARTGARVGLVTTAGFRDMLAIGHQARRSLYDQTARHPDPIVASGRTWELAERTAADGSEIKTVDSADLQRLADHIRAAAPDVVVVSFLNAYMNPEHERFVAERLRALGAAPAVFAATSVTREMREYERTSTAAINAYVQPRVADYLERLEKRLTDLDVPARMWVMQSNGGLLGARVAQQQSVRTVLSGLAGGVVGAARWAGELGLPLAVSFDVGGTSTDIALIRDGLPDEVNTGDLDGYPLRMPAVDVHTIGAGGGSLAWRDSGGGLRVGPHSAGASPGPACYGRGGAEITVTDAHVLLGRLGDTLLDGRLQLDLDAARPHLADLAARLDLDAGETAAGVLRVINATIARGVRKVSVERGADLRECTLIAFGGAGPLHAGDLIRELGMRAAVIPPHPGIASAVGMLDAPVRQDFACAVSGTSAQDMPEVAEALDRLAQQAHEFLVTEETVNPETTHVERLVDTRYLGQSYELTVPWRDSFADLRAVFDQHHAERYGFEDPAALLEVVAARVVATADQSATVSAPRRSVVDAPNPIGHRRTFFDQRWHQTPIYRREHLPAGSELAGPLIVEQLDSTIVVGPGQHCRNDERGFLHIESEAQ